MTAPEGHGELPHEPAPPEPRRIIPERPMLVRGLGLALLAAGGLWGAMLLARNGPWLVKPLALLPGVIGVLAGWAAAIHLTGGEKFDDHPWV